ncbi:hypothetical protein BS47DRAFT_632591 [Hydnum rufescens UP504]|uniref:Uncharacterized protein n=1 Tax=Hydnum rufescens UP504 TaxID=1448309 RepID=A0A9P6AF04_9AGAM|nr:hypothetical protein BS47DRAFT_632591 [Hydnum rufescens UP504]
MGALVQGGIREERRITEPLLNPEGRRTETTVVSHDEIRRVSPLPKLQVALIVVAYLSEPVTVSFIYPFINERLSEMSSTPKELARRSGLLFACYAFTKFISSAYNKSDCHKELISWRQPTSGVLCRIEWAASPFCSFASSFVRYRLLDLGLALLSWRFSYSELSLAPVMARAFSLLVLSRAVGSALSYVTPPYVL